MCTIQRLTLTVLLLATPLVAIADEPSKFVLTQQGELPIILSAPHGGQQSVPDVDERTQGDRGTGGAGFVTVRDTGTEELAQQVAKTIEKRFGRKPYFVISRVHRKYLDPNRPPELAYDDPDAKPVYDTYHGALKDACQSVQNKFHRGLLLDLHGQATDAEVAFRGTQDGKTVTLLKERFGPEAIHGEMSLFGRLKTRGWKVHPDPFDGKEQSSFRGGYIVQTYGSHHNTGVDAFQLELGGRFRNAENRNQTAATLTEAVVDYARDYLDVVAATPPATKEAGSK